MSDEQQESYAKEQLGVKAGEAKMPRMARNKSEDSLGSPRYSAKIQISLTFSWDFHKFSDSLRFPGFPGLWPPCFSKGLSKNRNEAVSE